MFGFGGLGEIAFIFFLAMLIFGPEKLPEFGRLLAKGMAEVRKASNELKRTLNAELAISEQEAEARRLAALAPPPPAGTLGPIVPAGPVALSTEPPLFPPLSAADPADPGEAATIPVLRPAQMTVPSLPPGHRAAEAASGAGGADVEPEAAAGNADVAAAASGETAAERGKATAAGDDGVPAGGGAAVPGEVAAPLAPYGQGRDPRGERADADVN
jgi:Sec-independent protein translocase protein TatA